MSTFCPCFGVGLAHDDDGRPQDFQAFRRAADGRQPLLHAGIEGFAAFLRVGRAEK